MDQGWVRLHRKMLDSPIFDNPKLLKMWIWCLLKASHKGYKQAVGLEVVEIRKGQFITGRNKGSLELGFTPTTWYKYLKILEERNMLELESDSKKTLVTIVNWEKYQDGEKKEKGTAKEQQRNSEGTAKEQQRNTNKNVKNVKNDKNDKKTLIGPVDFGPVVDLWNSFAPNKIKKINPGSAREKHLRKRIEEDGLENVLRAIKFVEQSSFLQGGNDRGWIATFDWIIDCTNFQKILEGNYQDKSKTKSKPVDMGEEEALRSLGVKF